MSQQKTIEKPAEVAGRGLFTGEECRMRFRPAAPDAGITFIRTDLPAPVRIAADVANVGKRARRTTLMNGSVAVETVEQIVYIVTSRDKFRLLYHILEQRKDHRTLIFCNRRDHSNTLTSKLKKHGVACELLSGAVRQKKRLKILDDFRAGTVKVVVATDVAGRGLHVKDIGLVVNYEFPYEPEDYVHRIGRTGRAGVAGTAISFACEDESFTIPAIEKYIGNSLHCTMPDEELIAPIPTSR